ncbi:MAG: hypothetical protein MUQ25_13740 [Candidatus Aminicenantes bacterium]|nr:hypothetical protein [Candidatus Aminicenantes bacterium]
MLALFLRSVGLLLFLSVRLKISEKRSKMKNQKESPPATQTEKRPAPLSSNESEKKSKPPFRPLPGQPLSPADPGSPSGTISPAGDQGEPIDDEIAGELANAPFTLINIFEPAWEVMDEARMTKTGHALRLYLEKKGKAGLLTPELLLVVSIYPYLFKQAKNVRNANIERKKKKVQNVTDDRRPAGDGENEPGVVGGPAV